MSPTVEQIVLPWGNFSSEEGVFRRLFDTGAIANEWAVNFPPHGHWDHGHGFSG